MPNYIVWKSARDESDNSRLLSHVSEVTNVSENDGCIYFTNDKGVDCVADQADTLRVCGSYDEMREYLDIETIQ